MPSAQSSITIHMLCSLDSYIASEDNDISWMESTDYYEKGVTLTENDIEAFNNKIDCYVMGSKTYEHALQLGWPYGDTPVIVLTRRGLQSKRPEVQFISGDLHQIVNHQLKPKFRNIWVVGGARLTREFILAHLADNLVISIMPIILGDGTLFFDHFGKQIPLQLKDATAYKNGMVELCYEIQN